MHGRPAHAAWPPISAYTKAWKACTQAGSLNRRPRTGLRPYKGGLDQKAGRRRQASRA